MMRPGPGAPGTSRAGIGIVASRASTSAARFAALSAFAFAAVSVQCAGHDPHWLTGVSHTPHQQRSQCSRSKPGRIGLRWQSYRAWIRAAGFVSPRNSTSSSNSGAAAREEEAADDDVSGVFLLGS